MREEKTVLELEGIFKNRVPDDAKLVDFGFQKTGSQYTSSYQILGGQFVMYVTICPGNVPAVKVVDTECEEEYVLIHAREASGSFVGSVVQACEEKLMEIAEACFVQQVFVSRQAKEIIAFVGEKYQSQLEYLWKKFPQNAVLRRKDTSKWYAALLTVAKGKLGLPQEGEIEIVDLRGKPEEIAQLLDGKRYFPGYHMNKKNWYTICLNDTVDTQEICRRIEESYTLAGK